MRRGDHDVRTLRPWGRKRALHRSNRHVHERRGVALPMPMGSGAAWSGAAVRGALRGVLYERLRLKVQQQSHALERCVRSALHAAPHHPRTAPPTAYIYMVQRAN